MLCSLLVLFSVALHGVTASVSTTRHPFLVQKPSTTILASYSSTIPGMRSTRRRRSSSPARPQRQEDDDEYAAFGFLDKLHPPEEQNNENDIATVQPCRSFGGVLARGALLRIASDLSGGTPLENIKTRVTVTQENMWQSMCHIYQTSGLAGFWSGSSSRSVEGALIGAVFMLGSVVTKARLKALGAPPIACALGGGLVGGVAQAFIMTPAGMIFTSLNVNRGKKGYENETAWSVTRRVIKEKGFMGMYYGFKPMAIRQASNWASRAGFTEIARSVLNLQQYGILGEIASGTLGGVGSCWNTPIETIRVVTQRDISTGVPTKTMAGYWKEISERDGVSGLFRGITPRAIQAVWQTCFLVVVPNMMGL